MARNKGFSIVEIFIVVLVLALAGFLAWKVWVITTPAPVDQTPTTTQQDTDVNSEADLNKVDKTLDSTNVESDELKQLDTQVSF